MDYHQYQGPVEEWEGFVRNTGFVQPPQPSISPEEFRSLTNSARTAASQASLKNLGLSDRVVWRDYCILTRDFQDIIARVYKPKNVGPETLPLLPVYLHFHGGGHLFGNIETEDANCAGIVAAYPSPGVIVVNVNYRHTPEFRWPTQFNDAWDSCEWLSAHISQLGGDPARVVVGGISAGGGLAASVVARRHELSRLLAGKPPPPSPSGPPSSSSSSSSSSSAGLSFKGQVLCSPWLLHPAASPFSSQALSSFNQNQLAPILPWSALKLFSELLGPNAVTDPQFNVALAPGDKIQGLPKASCLIAGQDLLRDEGLYYADKLKENGVPTKVHVFPGLPHGFRRFTELPSTKRWEELIVESIQWCLSTDTESTLVVEGTR